MPKVEITTLNAERYTRYIVIILSLVAIVDNFYREDWITLCSAILTIVFLMVPIAFEKLSHIKLPVSFRVVYLMYIIASMYLGEIHSFFYRIIWWDIVLHTASAMMMAYIAIILVYMLNRKVASELRLSPFFIALFAFCFPVAIGAVWELFEFAMDKIFGVNMIKAIDPNDATRYYDLGKGFLNSLHDLVMDVTGALIVSVGAYIHLKRKGGVQSKGRVFQKQEKQVVPVLIDTELD